MRIIITTECQPVIKTSSSSQARTPRKQSLELEVVSSCILRFLDIIATLRASGGGLVSPSRLEIDVEGV